MGKSPHTAATPRPGAIDWADARTQRVESTSRATIFAQGDPATNVLYIEDGTVRLSVLSHAGRRRSWPSEKRLARALLLLARYGDPETPRRTLPKVSRETLAEMVGTTRSRVNFFMNKFRKLGFVDYNNRGIAITNSLLSVVVPSRMECPELSKQDGSAA